jgi:hypothetical protein
MSGVLADMNDVVLEYQCIGLLATCLGNERIRITADGRVEHSVNTRECEAGQLWNNGWREVGRLDADALERLLHAIRQNGLFALPPTMIEEDVEGGRRDELRVRLDGVEHCFVVQNREVPELRSVVRLIRDALASVRLL